MAPAKLEVCVEILPLQIFPAEIVPRRTQPCRGGGGIFTGGIFRCGKFRISNVCEISHSIFRPLCEINTVRNLATGAKLSHWGFAGFAGGMLLPPFPPFHGLLGKRPLDASSFMDLCKKRHRKETRK